MIENTPGLINDNAGMINQDTGLIEENTGLINETNDTEYTVNGKKSATGKKRKGQQTSKFSTTCNQKSTPVQKQIPSRS